MKKMIQKNYKTTVQGVLILVAVGLRWAGYIDSTQLAEGIGLLAAAGFIASKDADSKEQ